MADAGSAAPPTYDHVSDPGYHEDDQHSNADLDLFGCDVRRK